MSKKSLSNQNVDCKHQIVDTSYSENGFLYLQYVHARAHKHTHTHTHTHTQTNMQCHAIKLNWFVGHRRHTTEISIIYSDSFSLKVNILTVQ